MIDGPTVLSKLRYAAISTNNEEILYLQYLRYFHVLPLLTQSKMKITVHPLFGGADMIVASSETGELRVEVNPEFQNYTYEQLSKVAREEADLGAVTSLVKVDGSPVAKLDVVSSMRSGKLDYKINSMENVTELYSKGFNVTIPEDTHYPDQNIGTWRSGAHG